MFQGFIFATPEIWYQQYPRYLTAITMRLEKAPMQLQKDKLWTQEFAIVHFEIRKNGQLD